MRVTMLVSGLLVALASMAMAEPVLEWAPTPGGPWTADPAAAIEEIGPYQWRTTTPIDLGIQLRFYRLAFEGDLASIEAGRIQAVPPMIELGYQGVVRLQELTISLPGEIPLVLVRLPVGTFRMGSPGSERGRTTSESPLHTVMIGSDLYMGKCEVTQAQWVAVMRRNPSSFGGDTSRPVETVTWNHAKDFVTALNNHIEATGQGPLTVRLPSEAEWEYACRAGTAARFSFGDSLSVNDSCEDDGLRSQYMWYCQDGTQPVGTKLPNAFGLYDMHGNVSEWCEDWHHFSYSGAPGDGSAWVVPESGLRVIRGGAPGQGAASGRSAARYPMAPTSRHRSIGLRLAAVQPQPGYTIMLPGGVPLVLVRIPAGTFLMGSGATERSRNADEGPRHVVTIGSGFYMGKYEVTQAQWLALMGSWPGAGPSSRVGLGDTYPAYYVSWNDAQGFITALNAHIVATSQGPWTVRLPTEAEWEWACRGGTSTRFSFGDSLSIDDYSCEDDGVRSQYMWYCGNNDPYGTKPVGRKLPNAWELYDMHGNVWEWCEDKYRSSYSGAPVDGSAWVEPGGWERVIRSGAWPDYGASCRSANRGYAAPTERDGDIIGLRLAADWVDGCPLDPLKTEPGVCGCGVADTDTDGDTVADCNDVCPGYDDRIDGDGDGVPDHCDLTWDSDGDGTPDWQEGCPLDPLKTEPGVCGCGVADTDTDGDTVADCNDVCPGYDDRIDENGNGIPDDCELAGMARIAAGSFAMGDTFREGPTDERPVHTVPVRTFYLDKSEVTKALWDEVYSWAVGHGYGFDNSGDGTAGTHPVQTVSWYDVVKWCNARSEKDGLVPCYYTSAAQTEVYRTGQVGVANEWVNWSANGYRLPTEAEWEKAARGGLAGKRYPWGDDIDATRANYHSGGTKPVGSYAPNGYGLYDMAGNVWEWCWDWYDGVWYDDAGATAADPRGPASGSYRVVRGGGWIYAPFALRCAYRGGLTPDFRDDNFGFRCARGQL